MNHREPDKEDDKADAASLEDINDVCTTCGQPLEGFEFCSDPTCEGSDEYDPDADLDEPDYPEGMLGEGDDDA